MITTKPYTYNMYCNNKFIEGYGDEDLARAEYQKYLAAKSAYNMTIISDVVEGALLSHEVRETGTTLKLVLESL